MPIISYFFGIVIKMFHNEHPPPHFHAGYQGFKAVVRVSDGQIIAGKLPKKAENIVRQWTLDHSAELMANWERGEAMIPMELIPGADVDD